MADFKQILPRITPELVGVPVNMIIDKIKDISRRFFRDTLVWQEFVELNTQVGVVDYDIIPTSGGVYKILDAKIAHVGLAFRTQFSLPTDTGRPTEYTSMGRGNIRISPIPDDIYTITVLVAKQPVLDIPDGYADEYSEAIATGVKAEMLIMNASWGNPQLGVGYLEEFEKRIADVRVEVSQSFGVGSQSIRLRRFI